MILTEVEVINFSQGEESRIAEIVSKSKVPLVFRPNYDVISKLGIKEFEDFLPSSCNPIKVISPQGTKQLDAKLAIEALKRNDSIRCCDYPASSKLIQQLRDQVKLFSFWRDRIRYSFGDSLLFFLGAGSVSTPVHIDRERNSTFQLALFGKRRYLLFNKDQSRNIYAKSFRTCASLIDFTKSPEFISQNFPLSNQARGYEVILNPGDFIYYPKNFWHFVEYIEPSAAVTYAFYPQKYDYWAGFITGSITNAFDASGLNLSGTRLYQKFAFKYAHSNKLERIFLKAIELVCMPLLSVVCLAYVFAIGVFTGQRASFGQRVNS